jgi:hypothetical protein
MKLSVYVPDGYRLRIRVNPDGSLEIVVEPLALGPTVSAFPKALSGALGGALLRWWMYWDAVNILFFIGRGRHASRKA